MKHKPKKLFIDVGVGRPNTEAWGREKDFTIIGLEPNPSRYNNLKDVYPGKLLNVAVADKKGEMKFWESQRYGSVLWLNRGDENRGFEKVKKKTIKVDSLPWRDFDEIHLWADIEGAELLMLKGATEMLSSGKVKWINLELRKITPSEAWATAEQIYEFLDKYGFKPQISLDQFGKAIHKDIIFTPK